MSYTTAEGRQTILEGIDEAMGSLEEAIAWLGEAYEHVDEAMGDRLESQIFRPAQSALATAKRTRQAFADRYRLTRSPAVADGQRPRPAAPREALERAEEAVREADATLAELQDSMLPVEVGDPELRAGLSRVRELIAPLPGGAAALVRGLGR